MNPEPSIRDDLFAKGGFFRGKRAAVIIFFILVTLFGVYEDYERGASPEGSIIFSVLFFIFVVVSFFLWRQQREHNRFIHQVYYGEYELDKNGYLRIGEHMIAKNTEVVYYTAILSLLIARYEYRSRFYVVDRERTGFPAFAYIMANTIGGWWSLPWGPVLTLQAIVLNAWGGKRQTLAALIEEVKQEVEKENKKKEKGRLHFLRK